MRRLHWADLELSSTIARHTSITVTAAVTRKHAGIADVTVVGATLTLPFVLRLELLDGRFINAGDDSMNVAVVGSAVVQRLAEQGVRVDTNTSIPLNGYYFKIIGILRNTTPNPMLSIDLNNVIFIPETTRHRISNSVVSDSMIIRLIDRTWTTEKIAHLVGEKLEKQFSPQTFEVVTAKQLLDGMNQQKGMFSILIAATSLMSAFIGGVSIANVMLSNTAERRGEIGLRMALGANKVDIIIMFLTEAVMLAVTGSIIGMTLGYVGSAIFARYSGWHFAASLATLPLVALGAIVVAIIAGLYPAYQASRLEPFESLKAI